jgi:hypothetical protein
LVLGRYSSESGDRFTLRKLAADSSTSAVIVYTEVLLEVAETASGVCFLAAGAGVREIFGARPEAVGLTIAEMVHAILFEQLAPVYLVNPRALEK